MKRRVYVASSWRNKHLHRGVVEVLRAAGHEVYDFTRPAPDNEGFSWAEIDPAWINWTPEQWRDALTHPRTEEGFKLDRDALDWADTGVCVLPCGRSAHLELGYLIGRGRPCAVLACEPTEPDMMVKLASGGLLVSFDELLGWMETLSSDAKCRRCDGCGEIADSEDGEPWTHWKRLPPGSDAAVRMGLVRPIKCPDCAGVGTVDMAAST